MGYVDEVLADSPAGLWLMEEAGSGTGVQLADEVVSGRYALTYTGSTPQTPGLVAGSVRCRRLDPVGDDNKMWWTGDSGPQAASYYTPPPGTSFALEAWVRLDTPGGPVGQQALWANQSHGASDARVYGVRFIADGGGATGSIETTIKQSIEDEGFGEAYIDNVVRTSPAAVVAGAVYHFVLEWDDAAKTRRHYLNGVLIDSWADPGSLGWVPSGSYNLFFGQDGGGGLPIAGEVDCPAYYDHTLSAARWLAHYEAGVGGGTVPMAGRRVFSLGF